MLASPDPNREAIIMEFDPETNTYTSDGPSGYTRRAEAELKTLEQRVEELESRVAYLEAKLDHR